MSAELIDKELFLAAAWEGLFDGMNPNADTDDFVESRTANSAAIFMCLKIIVSSLLFLDCTLIDDG